MENTVERVRDLLVGVVFGGFLSILILGASLIVAAISSASGNGFAPFRGGTYTTIAVILLLAGGGLGYLYGCYITKRSTMEKNVKKWIAKYNK